MENRKTFLVLNQFSVIKLNRLEKYLNSPYHNSNTNITQLGSILIDCVKNEKEPEDEYKIWKDIFKNQVYNDQKFRKLNSDLLKLIQEFLGHETLKSKKYVEVKLQLEGIINHKAKSLYNSIRKQAIKQEKLRVDRSAEYYKDLFEIEKLLFQMKTEFEKQSRKSKIGKELNISEMNFYLDRYYLIEKLKLNATLLSWKQVAEIETQIPNIETAGSLLGENEKEEIDAIQVYENIFNFLTNLDDVESYRNLKEIILKRINSFPLNEIRYIYDAAISYSIRRINKGDNIFLQELFDLYHEALSTNGFLVDNRITPITFRNVSSLGLRLGKVDWVESFIHQYSDHLDPKFRENAVSFSLARVHFYRHDYDKVIESLNQVDYEDVWYNLESKTLLIAAYYELQEIDALENLYNSFRVFISREKTISKPRKKHYLNYLNILLKLSRLSKRDQEKLKKMKVDVQETKGIVSKTWLLEKINALLK